MIGSDDELRAAAVPFLEQGLAAGEVTVLACPPATADVIAAGLGRRGDALENHPRICLLDTRAPDALSDTLRLIDRARSAGADRVRLVGQVQFGERPREWREGERYEAAANVLLADQPFAALCLYDTRVLSDDVLRSARATHPELVVGDVRRPSPDFTDPRTYLRRLPVPVEHVAEVLAIDDAPVLAELRHRLGAAISAHVADPDLAEDLHLAVSEVAANAFRHGSPPVSARIWAGPDQLVCEIADRGTGFADPLAGFLPAHGPDLGRGGMGLWLARKLFDSVDLRSGPHGLTVRLASGLR